MKKLQKQKKILNQFTKKLKEIKKYFISIKDIVVLESF